jgi:DNA-binding protein HU-beta
MGLRGKSSLNENKKSARNCRGEVMNKLELVNVVAAKTGQTKRACEEMLDVVLQTIKDTVSDGDKVTLVGFGTFAMMQRSARRGRNPRTGNAINIPARKVPRFVPGKEFKEVVA